MSKSVTTGQLPSANYRPVPYSRSHTTSALPAAPTMATVAEYPPATSQPYLIPRVMDPRPVLQKYGDAPTPYTTIASHHLAKGGNGGKSYEVRSYTDSYEGDSSSSQSRDAYPHREKVDGSKPDDSYENDPPYIRPRPPRFYIDAPRPYTSHNHRITSKVSSDGRNLGAGMIVSHRKKLFDEGKKSKEELAAEITKDYLKEIENYTSDTRYESFAMRLAVFEKKDGDFVPGSLEKRPSLSSSSGSLDRNLSLVEGGQGAADFEEVPNSLSVYFRPRGELEGGATEPSTHLLLPGGAVTAPPISMQRRGSSPGRDPPPYSRQFSDTDASSDASHSPLIERDRSPLMSIDENQEVRLRQKTARKALRQPSYLNAIDAPKSKVMNTDQLPVTSSAVTTATTVSASIDSTTSASTTAVVMRNRTQDDGTKLVRRTSYLMATNKERVQLHMERNREDITEEQDGVDAQVTPPKPSIKKLKSFFGEKTPRIVEAAERGGKLMDLPSPHQDVVKEGMLSCKTVLSDGKRNSDRSWKPVWAVLRGHALYLLKDRKDSSLNPMFLEEQPVSIKSSVVDIAHSYTKKKNVFRLSTYNGSEYLLQADDQHTMMSWIQVIQSHNNPDADERFVVNSDLILRKSNQVESKHLASPQVSQKSSKKLSTLSFRTKSPGLHSPAIKQRKGSADCDSPKGKESKTWKGKMAKSFKRSFGSSQAPVPEGGAFGVHLEVCQASSFSEFVPLVVELCTKIIEMRGMDMTGIYRVPGNKAAIAMLKDELDRGIDEVNADNEKWLDVNVISSLLKSFFRELPDPIVTDELYQLFINANRLENPEKRMLTLKKLIHELPEHNFETLQYIASHLHRVAHNGDINKMDARNLAIVFGPTLCRTTDESMATMVKDMSDQCKIVESILLHHEWFFSTWEMDDHIPEDPTELPPDAPISGMNQILLDKISENEKQQVNPKDIVSSIILAANKKVRRKDDKKSSSEERETSAERGYQERNIDQEIELRKTKVEIQTSSNSSSSNSSSSSSSTATTTTKHLTSSSSLTTTTTTSSSTASNSNNTVHLESRKEIESRKESAAAAQQQKTNTNSKSSNSDGLFAAKMIFVQNRKDSQSSMDTQSTSTKSEEMEDDQRNNGNVAQYSAFQRNFTSYHGSSRSNSKVAGIMRRHSEENLADRAEHDVEVNFQRGGAVSHAAQQHRKRLELDTKALRQKEEELRLEHEKRETVKMLIEEEMRKEQEELEHEESSDELIGTPADIAMKVSDFSARLNDLGNRADSTSITSDYSTTSSTNIGSDTKAMMLHNVAAGNSSDYSSNTSPTSVHLEQPKMNREATSDYSNSNSMTSLTLGPLEVKTGTLNLDSGSKGGMKYFALSSMSPKAHSTSNKEKSPPSLVEDLVIAPERAPTLQARRPSSEQKPSGFDTQKVAMKGTLSRKKCSLTVDEASRSKSPNRDSSDSEQKRPSSFRRGSLDSLRDFYEHPGGEGRTSWASSASEDGCDLLASLTATFDQKLKVLLDPKYKLNAAGEAQKSDSSLPDGNAGKKTSPQHKERDSKPREPYPRRGSREFQSVRGERHAPNSATGLRRNKSSEVLFDRQLTVPKIPRSSKSETKVGIASRFERRDSKDSSRDSRNSKDSRTHSSHSHSSSRTPRSKSEKTDVNMARKHSGGGSGDGRGIGTGHHREGSKPRHRESPAREATRQKRGLSPGKERPAKGRHSGDSSRDLALAKAKSASPPVRRKNPPNKKVRRRHTVGGTQDLEHFKAALTVLQDSSPTDNDERATAWDRLQPNLQDSPTREERNLKSWIEKEKRLRASTQSPERVANAVLAGRSLPVSQSTPRVLGHRQGGGGTPLMSHHNLSTASSSTSSLEPASPRGDRLVSKATFTFESSI